MPELPEVEITRLGISPHLLGKHIVEVIVKRRDLRQPVSPGLADAEGAVIDSVSRRSKYLILGCSDGASILIHLGMSGSLRMVPEDDEWRKHDHLAFTLPDRLQLRYHDPRRFGIVLRLPSADMDACPLLAHLGPEPLEDSFHGNALRAALANKTIPIKVALMDPKTVVGVGNIYASEGLFRAGVHPGVPANKISKPKAGRIVRAVREVLLESIEFGGTTLRDFLKSDGEPGYFRQRLYVYGRKGQPCRICKTTISHTVMGQRATFWCGKCQKR